MRAGTLPISGLALRMPSRATALAAPQNSHSESAKATSKPDDIIVADEDSVVVVPWDLLDPVLDRVLAMSTKDSQARHDIAKGLPLLQALDKYGHL
jgi:regulator of RNase E activity RraA